MKVMTRIFRPCKACSIAAVAAFGLLVMPADAGEATEKSDGLTELLLPTFYASTFASVCPHFELSKEAYDQEMQRIYGKLYELGHGVEALSQKSGAIKASLKAKIFEDLKEYGFEGATPDSICALAKREIAAGTPTSALLKTK